MIKHFYSKHIKPVATRVRNGLAAGFNSGPVDNWITFFGGSLSALAVSRPELDDFADPNERFSRIALPLFLIAVVATVLLILDGRLTRKLASARKQLPGILASNFNSFYYLLATSDYVAESIAPTIAPEASHLALWQYSAAISGGITLILIVRDWRTAIRLREESEREPQELLLLNEAVDTVNEGITVGSRQDALRAVIIPLGTSLTFCGILPNIIPGWPDLGKSPAQALYDILFSIGFTGLAMGCDGLLNDYLIAHLRSSECGMIVGATSDFAYFTVVATYAVSTKDPAYWAKAVLVALGLTAGTSVGGYIRAKHERTAGRRAGYAELDPERREGDDPWHVKCLTSCLPTAEDLL